MYLPMLGVGMLVAGAMQRVGGRATWTVAGIVLLLLGARSFAQTGVWQDTSSLAANEFRAVDPDSPTGHSMLAALYVNAKQYPEAEREYRLTFASLKSQGKPVKPHMNFGYGNSLLGQGRAREAIAQYRIAIPQLPPRQQAEAYNNLGLAFQQIGDLAEARQQFLAALALQPNAPEVRQNLDRLGSN
jgi:Tfp pilus assembly protein PilF